MFRIIYEIIHSNKKRVITVLLQQEPDNLDDMVCRSIIDYYIQRPSPIRHIFLAEFVSHYKKNGAPISKRKKPSVI
jgi:hypothetical protein